VDRAALDVAMEAGIPVGGWCPAGRRAEDGAIPAKYPLDELDSPEYGTRTEKNVVCSDGTLVLNMGELEDGTLATATLSEHHRKPLLIVPLEREGDAREVASWIEATGIRVLNIAGPRESKRPGVYDRAVAFLRRLLAEEPC